VEYLTKAPATKVAYLKQKTLHRDVLLIAPRQRILEVLKLQEEFKSGLQIAKDMTIARQATPHLCLRVLFMSANLRMMSGYIKAKLMRKAVTWP
jgi:hypothetical protein